MSAAADDLVGRGQALAVIDRVLDAVAAGGPGFLAVGATRQRRSCAGSGTAWRAARARPVRAVAPAWSS